MPFSWIALPLLLLMHVKNHRFGRLLRPVALIAAGWFLIATIPVLGLLLVVLALIAWQAYDVKRLIDGLQVSVP